ncbi:MAG: ABC transporter ATP-binding protein, partial [Deltaproteobacteria bacterium]|nr:ABC transporter ATP-binding protein [Deltaproteobacteria bacterium]
MAIVKAENIQFRYDGDWILKNLSFETCEGEFLGIIGPNGSGKTTLLKIIDGILMSKKGSVLINEINIGKIKRYDIAKIIAVVPQDSPVIFPFTVQEIVLMGRAPHLGRLRFEGQTDFEIVREAMEMVDILPFAARSINELSGGERQRVLIARALTQQPQIILLDESTAFLDIKHQIAFFDLIKSLSKEESLTVIAVTHDINLASLFCDRIMLLNEGVIHCIGTPEEVITESNIKEVYET